MAEYLVSLLSFGAIYALLAIGFNLQWGHTGLVNLGFVAFFALGAYTAALMTIDGAPLWLGAIAGCVVSCSGAYLLGRVTLRLQDDYLAIVAFGFVEVVRAVLMNTDAVGGPNGLTGIPPLLGALPADIRRPFQLALLVAVVAVVVVLVDRLIESPYGPTLRAIRDDPLAARSLGKPVETFRMVALVLGSAITAIAGALYASYIGYISPDQFDATLTFLVFTGVVVGGSSNWGATLGTLVFISIMESTRFLSDLGLPISQAQFAQVRLITIGLVLILIMQRRRQGLWPYRPRPRAMRRDDAAA